MAFVLAFLFAAASVGAYSLARRRAEIDTETSSTPPEEMRETAVKGWSSLDPVYVQFRWTPTVTGEGGWSGPFDPQAELRQAKNAAMNVCHDLWRQAGVGWEIQVWKFNPRTNEWSFETAFITGECLDRNF
jgi:hypothetical protein